MRTGPHDLKRCFTNRSVEGIVCCSDALEFLRDLRKESASVIFLDPPFNLGKVYSEEKPQLDCVPEDLYRRWFQAVLLESVRILEPGGALYLYHLPAWAMRFGAYLELHLRFRQWIAVSMKNGFVRGPRLYPAHYALTLFTKGAPRTFRRPRIPLEQCRHCGEYVKDYGGYLALVEYKGVNLSDFWDDLSPVRHLKRKNRPANELPEVFFRRILEISGRRNSLFVDPFMGSGTGVIAAARFGMKFAANDILVQNCDLACRRLGNLLKGRPPRADATG